MQKIIKTFLILLIIFSAYPATVEAKTKTTLNDLIENAKKFNGQEVVISGEAIGECLERGAYCWVNINDGTNDIGLWMTKEDAGRILTYGNYRNKGDIIQITGVFFRACKEHGGEADVHVSSLVVEKEGYPVIKTIPAAKIISAILLVPVALLILLVVLRINNKNITV
jgi:hypothetical protein